MNTKRFALCTLIGSVFVFAYEFVVHGILLVPTYELTPELWRPMEEYEALMPFAISMQILTTAVLCFLYTRHHEGKGIGEGIRFGVIVGLLLGLLEFSNFAWMPISLGLAVSWLGVSVAKVTVLGALFSLLYKK